MAIQLLSHVWPFVTPWNTACQASLSFTICWSLLKFMSNLMSMTSSQWCHPSVSSSVVPFSSCLQSFPASGSFPMSQFFTSGGQSIGISASASTLPMHIQNWVPLGLTGLMSLQAKELSRIYSQHHSLKVSILWLSALFIAQLSHPYMMTLFCFVLFYW